MPKSTTKPINPQEIKQHALSAAFPAMSPMEFAELVNDIRTHGQKELITLFDGQVLDGWHRYQACAQLGIEAAWCVLEDEDPVSFVQSLNLQRRHLTGSQRAAAVVACNEWAQSGDNQHTRGGDAPSSPATVETMAKAAEVSPRTIQRAKRAQEAGLGTAVRDGKVSAEKAAAVAKLPEPERQAALEAPAPPRSPKPAEGPEEAELKALIENLRAEMREAGALLQATEEENQSLARILAADDKVAESLKELKRVREMNRVIEERNRGLMSQNHALSQTAKSWKTKFERLEKKVKASATATPEPEPEAQAPEPEEVQSLQALFDGPAPRTA